MKKFLTIMLVIIVTVALSFTVYYLVRDDESIYLSRTTLYVTSGDDFNIDINFDNKKSYTKHEVNVDKDQIVRHNGGNEFTALTGGYTKVLFQTNNANYRNLDCVVYVGDGTSKSTPFYIQTADQLLQIGKADEKGIVKYPLNAYYELRNNLVLSDLADINLGYWSPIGYNNETGIEQEFTGYFDGKGYSIVNLNLDKYSYNNEVTTGNLQMTAQSYTNAGLFSKLGMGAIVKNIKFENASINGSYETAGIVAGLSTAGKIERIEILKATLNLQGTNFGGTIVGRMTSQLVGKVYSIATIDRVGINLDLNYPSQVFGGIVGENVGGYVIYSYVTGNADLFQEYANFVFGGIVGKNTVAINRVEGSSVDVKVGAHVKDTYTSMTYTYIIPESKENNLATSSIGMVIGANKTFVGQKDVAGEMVTTYSNKIIGNYYNNTTSNVNINEELRNFKGVSIYRNESDATLTYGDATTGDTVYEVVGLTAENMLLKESYLSHISDSRIITWKFGTVWIEVYNALPVLDYADQVVTSDLTDIGDGVEVNSIEGLINKLTGLDEDFDINTQPIVLSQDIDLSSIIWTPIGTESAPFNGKIYASYDPDIYADTGEKVYYKILNLHTQTQTITIGKNNVIAGPSSTLTYSAMFNYLGTEAELHNVIIENSTIINGDYSAGIAVVNKGLIEDCAVVNSTIQGSIKAGGLVVYNEGTITNYFNKTSESTGVYGNGIYLKNSNVKVSVSTSGLDVAVGGIAVENNGNIKNAVVTGSENNYVSILANDNAINSAYLGGIAAINNATISDSYVSFTSSSNGINTNGNFTAVAGGIAGTTKGVINRSYASTNISVSMTRTNSIAAGIAGEVIGTGNISVSGFYGNNKMISGYNASGIAGLLNQSLKRKIALDGWDAFWGNAKLTTTKMDMGTGIIQSFIEGSVTIMGERVGGLVVDLTSGAILDSYVGAVTLKGYSSASQVANFALKATSSPRDKDGDKFTTGIIAYCYSNASFDNPGTSYGVSGNDILEAVAMQVENKTSAFGVGLIVSKSKTNGTKFFGEGWPMYNWFKDGQYNCKASEDDMYPSNSTNNKYVGFGFDSSIWGFDSNQLGGNRVGDLGPVLNNSIVDTSILIVD